MTIKSVFALNVVAVLAIGLTVLSAGCKKTDDAPTNTANSTFVGGKSAADSMSLQRAEGHRPRLPGKGAGN